MDKDCGGRRVGLFGPLCSNQPPVETYDRPAISPGHHHAFDRWDEHMYEFQFGKGPMDPKGSRYVLPSAFEMDMGEANPPAGRVDQTRIDSLGLKVGQSFGYWFDFGSSSTPRNRIFSRGSDLTHQSGGVALCAASRPGASGETCRTVGGNATPVAWNTEPQVP
jgi:hypothetical protein